MFWAGELEKADRTIRVAFHRSFLRKQVKADKGFAEEVLEALVLLHDFDVREEDVDDLPNHLRILELA